jgi:murein DD-endopeptidase MepM/ murein hydrolase activator NlpD
MIGARQLIALALLVPGLVLLGPSMTLTGPRAQPGAAAPRRLPVSRTKGPAQAGRRGRCVHIVGRGDALARVAARYRTTRRAIIAANGLATPVRLRVGQRLHVSGCPAARAHRHDEPEVGPVSATQVLARVGPLRVPTRLSLAVPDFHRDVGAFRWPVDGVVASSFGRRRRGWHAGIDIQADTGTPFRAAAGGTVIVSGWERYYGLVIKIEHNGGITTTYAHNLENLVDTGDEVRAGDVIGTVGRSGHATANHLHFEIRQEGVAYNPLHVLPAPEATLLAGAASSTATALSADDEDRE